MTLDLLQLIYSVLVYSVCVWRKMTKAVLGVECVVGC